MKNWDIPFKALSKNITNSNVIRLEQRVLLMKKRLKTNN
jgi:hypothetical protein